MDQKSKSGGVWQRDLLASVVVFLVALPLCMGIAIASGVPVSAGIMTGIIGGIVVGTLAGSPLQVSGPAAGLTVIVFEVVQRHGLERMGIVVLLAGGLQFLAGLAKLGPWFRAVSPAVIQGMLAGIGILIFGSQFHVMVDDTPKGSGLKNLATIPEAFLKGLPLPEMTSYESRHKRMEHLKAFGTLHARQVQILETVSQRVPAVLEGRELEFSSDQFADLLEKQRSVQAEIDDLIEQVRQFEEQDDPDRKDVIESRIKALITSQSQTIYDLEHADADSLRKTQRDAEMAITAIMSELKNHEWAAKVGILTILIIVGWEMGVPKRWKLVPSSLVAVVGVSAATAVLNLPVLFVEVPDNLFSEIRLPTLLILQDAPWGAMLISATVIAVVASAETLLCATAVDQLHSGPRTNYDRELVAQGAGNLLCGVIGTLPMTGVIVRSAANVQAGGKTRMSAILHGIWLLIFVVLMSNLLRMIPTACLAAMLVYIGLKLVNVKSLKALARYGRGEVAIYTTTVLAIVSFDLLTGVILGIVLSSLKLLYTFSHMQADLICNEEQKSARLELRGAATFIRLPLLAEQLERVPRGYQLHVDFEHLDYIDHACLDLLMNWSKQHQSIGGELFIDWDTLHGRFRREMVSENSAPNEA